MIDQIAELCGIANAGVALQARAERAVRCCGEYDPVPAAVAVELRELSGEYSTLYFRAEALRACAELEQGRRELMSILSYHLHMLRDAGDLVFGSCPAQNERFRRELAEGLGPRALDLGAVPIRILELVRPDDAFR